MSHARLARSFLICVFATATPAIAQRRHYTCEEAARIVESTQVVETDPQAGWALSEIAGCPDGPAAIAARWRMTGDRPDALLQLRTWNYMLRDQRIAEAAMAVARDPARPTDLRLVALQTLVAYFDSSATMELETLRNPPRFPSLGHVSHPTLRVGTQPPGADMPDHVQALARDLTADPDTVVARAARAVWQALTDRRPMIALLAPGTLSLENLCDRKFHIANRSKIDLTVELILSGGRPPRLDRIPAEGRLDLRLATDTVHLLYAGREIAVAMASQTECR